MLKFKYHFPEIVIRRILGIDQMIAEKREEIRIKRNRSKKYGTPAAAAGTAANSTPTAAGAVPAGAVAASAAGATSAPGVPEAQVPTTAPSPAPAKFTVEQIERDIFDSTISGFAQAKALKLRFDHESNILFQERMRGWMSSYVRLACSLPGDFSLNQAMKNVESNCCSFFMS
jgi:hypothetical protein